MDELMDGWMDGWMDAYEDGIYACIDANQDGTFHA
jgi:hypothetical protein